MSTTQNLTLLTDFYELTMMQGYFKNPVQETVLPHKPLRQWICHRSRTRPGY